jgi:divalent metal cation (Fe/Co/Zn/Cd) transporter
LKVLPTSRSQVKEEFIFVIKQFTSVLFQVLLAAKMVAAVMSGSISIISSLVDSVVDLASGVIIWATGRAVRTRNPYVYPQG